jgi:hypothetical protein
MLHCIDLTGLWQIKFDARDEGTQLGWAQQPPADGSRSMSRRVGITFCKRITKGWWIFIGVPNARTL